MTKSQAILNELKPYASNEYRTKLLARLEVILDKLANKGTIAKAILYGSYLSDKPEPSDIDIIIWLESNTKHWFLWSSRMESESKLADPKIDLNLIKGQLFWAMFKWITGTKELIE
jgi:predicted nucleotidyltransferase